MLILTIRTDKPEAELGLFNDTNPIKQFNWLAHRQLAETLHHKIEEMLSAADKNWSDIGGIVAYRGPGSFTGLRIGLSVANALAGSLSIPLAGLTGDDWQAEGIKLLMNGQTGQLVLPEYGGEVFTTTPKK